MTRGNFIYITPMVLAGGVVTPRTKRIPTMPEEINKLTGAINKYIQGLMGGVVDIRQWNKSVDAWEDITGGCYK